MCGPATSTASTAAAFSTEGFTAPHPTASTAPTFSTEGFTATHSTAPHSTPPRAGKAVVGLEVRSQDPQEMVKEVQSKLEAQFGPATPLRSAAAWQHSAGRQRSTAALVDLRIVAPGEALRKL